jgi:hypothetical protein
MCAFTVSESGVSGRAISSRSTGTSGRYLVASGRYLAGRLWISPTPLSVKSETLMTR